MAGPDVKTGVDVVAIGGATTSIATANGGVPAGVDWLPYIAAGLSIVWLLIRIWESETVMRFRGKPPRE